MVKGGKRYYSKATGGKWFPHAVPEENESRTRETCTSTGIMLTQIEPSLPQALYFQRYPKWKADKKSREHFSNHDNRYDLRGDVAIFSSGVGRKRYMDDRRQFNSNFCLCHRGADGHGDVGPSLTAYQREFQEKASVGLLTGSRRFTHNHQQKSADAALIREQPYWFGQEVLVGAESSAPCEFENSLICPF